MTPHLSDDTKIEALARLVETELVHPPRAGGEAAIDQAGRRRFQNAVAARAASRRPPARLALAAIVLGVAAAVALFVLWPASSLDPNQTTASTRAPSVPAFVQASATGQGERVRFPDGSTLALTPGSRGRIAQRERGAAITLEEGELELDVAHRPGQDWAVHAGPFVVRVTGTKLNVVWRSADQHFAVTLTEGSVKVHSPLSPEPVSVTKGMILEADLSEGVQSVGGAEIDDGAPEPAIETIDDAPAPSGAGAVGSRESWSALMAQGQFDAVLSAAEARGLEACYSGCSGADLKALGDAARYRGRGAIARRALLAQRERFAGTPTAASAAFVLGRMAEGGGNIGGALGWYDRYLVEAPGGPFAADALGRKLQIVSKRGGAAALSVAQQYLARFPDGAHAATARMVLTAHGSAAADRP